MHNNGSEVTNNIIELDGAAVSGRTKTDADDLIYVVQDYIVQIAFGTNLLHECTLRCAEDCLTAEAYKSNWTFSLRPRPRERASWLCTQPPTSPVIGQPLHVYVPQESWYTYFGLFILNQAHLVTTSAASRSDSSFRLVFGCFDVFQCAVPFNN